MKSLANIGFFRPYPYGGGSNFALIQSLNQFSRHNGKVYTETVGKQLDGTQNSNNLKFKLEKPETFNLRLGINIYSSIRNIKEVEDLELIDAMELTNGYSYKLAKISRSSGIPFVVTVIETVYHETIKIIPPFRTYASYVTRNATAFRVYTNKSEEFLINMGVPRNSIHKIPIGIDTNLFFQDDDRKNKTLEIIYARRLEPKNGILDLLSAVKTLSEKGVKVTLLVIGDGPLESVVRSVPNIYPVKFIGRVPYYKLAELYREADIYCNVAHDKKFLGRTKQEDGQFTFPLLESQASGLPVITTDSGSNREIVEKGNLFISQGDKNEIVKAIEYLSDEGTRLSIGRKNRRFIESHFDGKKLQSDADNFYDRILNRKTVS